MLLFMMLVMWVCEGVLIEVLTLCNSSDQFLFCGCFRLSIPGLDLEFGVWMLTLDQKSTDIWSIILIYSILITIF